MSNFDSSLSECFGFSQIMISQFFRVSAARKLMSPRFPIGVETIYRPFFIIGLFVFFIYLVSCAPANNKSLKTKNILNPEILTNETKKKELLIKEEITSNDEGSAPVIEKVMLDRKITIILSKKDKPEIVQQFINVIELATYQKKIKNIFFEINIYENTDELKNLLDELKLSGKIFIGPLNSSDTKILNQYCNSGPIFFSFSSNKDLANECIYLVNFFPENEIRANFKYFPEDSKIALLYPENAYGFEINKNIDDIANLSNAVIVNRASYNENLSNTAEAIKELGKYELRKYELNRQKKILASKKDKESKKRLIKLEKFQTTKDLDFTHVIIADYGLRLLKVAPLLPYYDIDPNMVQFVGTGAWDDEVFYDEPSLNGAIYPGIEYKKRENLANKYYELYDEKLNRTSTLPYDLVGLLDFAITNNHNLTSFYNLLNEGKIKFSGVDGNFYFINNVIERNLDILKIKNGNVEKVSQYEWF